MDCAPPRRRASWSGSPPPPPPRPPRRGGGARPPRGPTGGGGRPEPQRLPGGVRAPEGWHVVHAPAAAKGRAGVSLYTRREPDRVRIGFGAAEFDSSGRYVEADLPGVTVASLFLPSGEVGTARQDEKVRFMDEFLVYLRNLRERAAADGREVIVCGDWNIAH